MASGLNSDSTAAAKEVEPAALVKTPASNATVANASPTVNGIRSSEKLRSENGGTSGLGNGVSNDVWNAKASELGSGQANAETNGAISRLASGLTNGLSSGLAIGLSNGQASGIKSSPSNGQLNNQANGLSNGQINSLDRSIRPHSVVNDRILEEAGSVSATKSPKSKRNSLLRKHSALNGRWSVSAQMLNGEGDSAIPNNNFNMGGGGRAVRPNRLSTPGMGLGEEDGQHPSNYLQNLRENLTSAISDIPSKSEIAKYRQSLTTLSENNTPLQHLSENGFEQTPTSPQGSTENGGYTTPLLRPLRPGKGRFVKVFPEIAEVDVVIKWYHCAYWNDMLFQGFLFVTSNWFCFHSKLMGKKRVVIPVGQVTGISKKKTALIIPNAIGVTTSTQKFLFGSLMSRDSTFDLMVEVWKQNQQTTDDVADKRLSDRSLTSNQTYSSDDCATVASSSSESYPGSRSHSLASPIDTTPSLDYSPDETSRQQNGRVGASGGELNGRRGNTLHDSGQQNIGSGLTNTVSMLGELLQKPVVRAVDMIAGLRSLSRTHVLLGLSTILVLFLLLSAMLLAYKLLVLQARIHSVSDLDWGTGPPSSQFSNPHSSSSFIPESSSQAEPLDETPHADISYDDRVDDADYIDEVLQKRNEDHYLIIDKINRILESHIHLLEQISEALRDVSQLTSKPCFYSSCQERPQYASHKSQHTGSTEIKGET